MPSGVRRRAARKAGRDIHVDRRAEAKKLKQKKANQLKAALKSNPVIAANWDSKLTLTQNYKKLGLKSKLNQAPGGSEKDFSKPASIPDEASHPAPSKSTTKSKAQSSRLGANEARIERDEDGNVVRIVYGTVEGDEIVSNKKDVEGDEEDEEEDDEEEDEEFEGFEDEQPTNSVVQQLEEMARNVIPSAPREQSDREQDWIADLVAKHGDDYEAMKWDKKLNVYQQSAGDLRRRVNKWKKTQK